MPIGRIISRGLTAAHSALLGALYLFLLQAPLQVMNAFAQGFQARAMPSSERQPDLNRMMQSLSLSCGSLILALAVLFLFPLVQGGILGRVRDRLETPDRPPGQLGAYGRIFYARLLGSAGLYMLVLFVLMSPGMCIGFGLAFQEMAKAMPAVTEEGSRPPDPQQLTRQLFVHPVVLVAMVVSVLLVSAASMVYWIANCIVVSEQERVMAAWRKSLRFCRQNFSAVLAIWLLSLAVGVLISPLSLVGPLGVISEVWVLAALALLYCAIIGYLGVLWAGVGMSLYLGCRPPSEQLEIAEGN
jgi:hypothetical protein